MYTKSAVLYDAIYEAIGKDYAAETRILQNLIQVHKLAQGNNLLDVACGTGGHIRYLQKMYSVEGLDLSVEMLEVARQKFPKVHFYQGNFINFELGRQYDIVLCLFSAIGYAIDQTQLKLAVRSMARHTAPGGVLIIEPWLSLDDIRQGQPHAVFVDKPDLKVARMNISRTEGRRFLMDFHYLVAKPQGVEHFTAHHELGLFTHDEYLRAFQKAGLEVLYEPGGLTGRGLYIGTKD
ncbi:MAG: class I SAM-dependent methyltransferase [Anaerolineales bacterium]|nr:class I SAM-dependent methyltransferase [Anaerolineales bacterium]